MTQCTFGRTCCSNDTKQGEEPDTGEHIAAEENVLSTKEGANKQVISSQADSLIKISRIWADF
ncbi:hypothetical protein M8N42_19835, partial [Enterobacter asburiae]|uniref:hypothetical protein n=1 Tax=Enterobacter asburiae TaxID=61645 RepID=UPI0020750918